MDLDTRNPEAKRLALKAIKTGTKVVTEALPDNQQSGVPGELQEIAEHCANLRVLDSRAEDEILGYDEFGLPG